MSFACRSTFCVLLSLLVLLLPMRLSAVVLHIDLDMPSPTQHHAPEADCESAQLTEHCTQADVQSTAEECCLDQCESASSMVPLMSARRAIFPCYPGVTPLVAYPAKPNSIVYPLYKPPMA